MSNLQIKTQSDLLAFLQDNLSDGKNLSIRGVAALCGIQHTSLIRDGAFASVKLAQTLTQHGFEAGALVENGFNSKATWLVIEYYAYESKAKAEGAKQIARTFGQLGVQLTFDKLSEKPKTALELAKEQVKLLEALELLELQNKALLEETDRLAEAVDELFEYSSIIRIAKYNNCSEKAFSWRVLKSASEALNLEIKKVPCPRYETKNIYSHDAWRLAYPGYNLPETTTLTINP